MDTTRSAATRRGWGRCRRLCGYSRSFHLWRFNLDVDILAAVAADIDDAGKNKQYYDCNKCKNNGNRSAATTTRINNSWAVGHVFLSCFI
ncbi:hypothetical protein X771_01290 [Mesorhizobium sp. LSJC277A00]|nr:hypothetical protein X771_01290 [Mesorhizobium sp. LSJC277A00]ESY43191.1 hypothetical protein X746_22965 [Mesorhizobium sp. LNJC380A00]